MSALGLGAMPLSLDERPEEADAVRVIHHALDLGVTLIDTADAYCLDEKDKHHNERLIAKALADYPGDASSVIVATKGGLMRPKGDWTTNGDPKHIAKTIRESYEALGGKKPIPLWQLHAVDPRFSIEDTLKPVREAVDEGLIRFVGLSNVGVKDIESARNVVSVVSIQNRFNPWDRSVEKNGVLNLCEKEKMTFFPWSPVGGWQNYKKVSEHPTFLAIARKYQVSPYQVVLSWLMSKSPAVLPIPGASRTASIEDSVKAVDFNLLPEEVRAVDQAAV